MYRWLRRRKSDILVIATLATVFILGVYENTVEDRPDARGNRPVNARNVGRKQLQADIEDSSFLTGNHLQQHRDTVETLKVGSQTLLEDARDSKYKDQRDQRPSLLVYVYDVPAMFTTDLLYCAINNTDNVSPRSENRFQSSASTSGNITNLELLFHRRLLNSRYLTNDATKADVFFVPFYASLACNCRSSNRFNITDFHDQLWQFVDRKLPYFRNGKPSRPHFMVLGKPERYHWTKNCPLLRDKEHTGGIIFIGPEKENNLELRKYAGRESSPMIVAPYPAHEPITINRAVPRNIFTFFYDNTFSGRGIRTILREQISNIHISSSSEAPVETDVFAVRFIDNLSHLGSSQSAYQWMRRSVFCLIAPGDTHIEQYLYDAISAGCIPVTFLPKQKKNNIEFPFDDYIDYSQFTVNIVPESVLSGIQNTTWYLSSLPKLRIEITQKKLKKYSKQLLYSQTNDSNDAFEMIVSEMVQLSS